MADDFTGIIRPMCAACFCPFCSEPMQSFQTCEVVTAHAMKMLAHTKCADQAKKDDDRDDSYDDEEDEE